MNQDKPKTNPDFLSFDSCGNWPNPLHTGTSITSVLFHPSVFKTNSPK